MNGIDKSAFIDGVKFSVRRRGIKRINLFVLLMENNQKWGGVFISLKFIVFQ